MNFNPYNPSQNFLNWATLVSFEALRLCFFYLLLFFCSRLSPLSPFLLLQQIPRMVSYYNIPVVKILVAPMTLELRLYFSSTALLSLFTSSLLPYFLSSLLVLPQLLSFPSPPLFYSPFLSSSLRESYFPSFPLVWESRSISFVTTYSEKGRKRYHPMSSSPFPPFLSPSSLFCISAIIALSFHMVID